MIEATEVVVVASWEDWQEEVDINSETWPAGTVYFTVLLRFSLDMLIENRKSGISLATGFLI